MHALLKDLPSRRNKRAGPRQWELARSDRVNKEMADAVESVV